MVLSSNTVNVIEQCRIAPPSASVSPISLPLTIFDVLWLPLPPLQHILLYEHPNFSKHHFTSTILPNIKQSLSFTLQFFLPWAGNLTWPRGSSKPEIQYSSGDSVLFIVAESDYAFHDLQRSLEVDVNALYPLVPELHSTPAKQPFPLIAFQVTLFPNKGISIGITSSHVVADGRSYLHFTKTWASICRKNQRTTSSLMPDSLMLPCFDRSTIKEPNAGIEAVMLNYLQKRNTTWDAIYSSKPRVVVTDKVFSTFIMRSADIKRLKKLLLTRLHINKKENAPSPLPPSSFVVTGAYVWVCLVKAQRWSVSGSVESDDDQLEYFLFTVDCRSRLDPPLPISYFGNCLRPIKVGAKISDLIGESGIIIAAELIGNAIQELEDGNAILKQMEWYLSSSVSPSLTERVLTVAGSTRFATYDRDFGWGKPKKSSLISIATSGAISLNECQNEQGAVEVSLARSQVELDAFASLFAKSIPLCKL